MSDLPVIHCYPPGVKRFFGPALDAELGERTYVTPADDDELLEMLPEIEILFGFRMDVPDWSVAKKLKMIQSTGAGVDWLLPANGLSPDVAVCNAKGAHEPHMPEFALAMLLGLAYRIPTLVDQQRAAKWKITQPLPLSGRTLCVVGLGTIGQSVARRAAALGMRVVGVRRSGAPIEGVETVVTPADRLQVLEGADAVVVITPLTDETRGLIGEAEFAALNPGALFVDLSRGGVTDTDALVAALESGQLRGAAVDVFEEEPLPSESPLWSVPNLLVTPHVAGNSLDYQRLIAVQFKANLEALERGETPPLLVDRDLGY